MKITGMDVNKSNDPRTDIRHCLPSITNNLRYWQKYADLRFFWI